MYDARSNYDIQFIEIYVCLLWKDLLRIGFLGLGNYLLFTILFGKKN